MATVTFVSESVFSDALTRGRCYEVLSRDDAKAQVRIVGNNRRRRWFPIACFAEGQIDVPRLRSVALEGQADLVVGPLEVTITLTDGTQRFCWVATPTRLSQSGDLLVVGEKSVRFHAPNHNLLILSDTSRASIEALLHHLDRQGELEGCTTAEGDFIERDEAGEPITGAYSLLIDGSFSDERYVAASRGALMNATIVDADSLVVSGSARFVDRLNHAEPTTFFVTTTRLSAGTLTHDLYRQGSLPAFVRKQWTFDDLVPITADDSMSNERLHSINGRGARQPT